MSRRRLRGALLTLGGVAALVVAPTSLRAQCGGTTATCTLTFALPVTTTVQRLTLSSATTALGTPTTADFTAGFLDAVGPVVAVKSNVGFTVSVVGASALFSYAGSAALPNKPASDLTWGAATGGGTGSCSGVSRPHSMAVAATLLTSAIGAPGIGEAAPSAMLCFRTLWPSASAVSGTYSLVVRFTLSAP